jgi:hypothetical protein
MSKHHYAPQADLARPLPCSAHLILRRPTTDSPPRHTVIARADTPSQPPEPNACVKIRRSGVACEEEGDTFQHPAHREDPLGLARNRSQGPPKDNAQHPRYARL